MWTGVASLHADVVAILNSAALQKKAGPFLHIVFRAAYRPYRLCKLVSAPALPECVDEVTFAILWTNLTNLFQSNPWGAGALKTTVAHLYHFAAATRRERGQTPLNLVELHAIGREMAQSISRVMNPELARLDMQFIVGLAPSDHHPDVYDWIRTAAWAAAATLAKYRPGSAPGVLHAAASSLGACTLSDTWIDINHFMAYSHGTLRQRLTTADESGATEDLQRKVYADLVGVWLHTTMDPAASVGPGRSSAKAHGAAYATRLLAELYPSGPGGGGGILAVALATRWGRHARRNLAAA
jgi:hypothetical protein